MDVLLEGLIAYEKNYYTAKITVSVSVRNQQPNWGLLGMMMPLDFAVVEGARTIFSLGSDDALSKDAATGSEDYDAR
jgi:hypothetical protein